MTSITKNVNFTEEDWKRLERNWTAWWEGELDRPMVILETVNTLLTDQRAFQRDFMLEISVDEVLDYYQAMLENGNFYGDSWPKLFVNHGPGIAAGFLGAEVTGMPEERTVWFEAKEKTPIEELQLTYDRKNIWWKRVQDITKGALERFGNTVAVAHTDIGGNLDILASFRTTQQLLYDLYDNPEEVMRLSGQITEAWIRYYNELHTLIEKAGRGTSNWAAVWSPGRTCMHQSDFCYMISPAMFEKFVLPDLHAVFDIMDHASYHLDGKGQIPHVDMLLSMDNLACIQWIPGEGQPGPEKWLDLLTRIRNGGKRCQVYVDPRSALEIVKELGGKGFALYVTKFFQPDEAKDFLKTLASEDISLK